MLRREEEEEKKGGRTNVVKKRDALPEGALRPVILTNECRDTTNGR